jgi:hypothetical protein
MFLLIQSARCEDSQSANPHDKTVEEKPKKTLLLKKPDKFFKRKQSNDVSEEDDSFQTVVESRSINRKKNSKKPTTITIPIKNAVVQALTQIDPHEAEAASHKPSRDSHEGDHHSDHSDIVYEDEPYHELEGWIPPPPPPPEHLFHRPLVPAPTFTRLSSIRAPSFMSSRLFGDDFALFLVILTIAGFFGLMLAMFMPFTFLMQQQPYGISGGYGGYPSYGQVPASSGIYGYPPYGRRRRRSLNYLDSRSFESTDGLLLRLSQALDKYHLSKKIIRTTSHNPIKPLKHGISFRKINVRSSVQTHKDR